MLIGVAFARGAVRCGTAVQAVGLPLDACGFALRGEGLHMDLPNDSVPVPAPDAGILERAPPLKPELQRDLTRGSSMGQEEMLKAAMALSMQGAEESEDLALAMKLSMEKADEKTTLQARVKALFEQYRASGMAPNEAAAKALAHAKGLAA